MQARIVADDKLAPYKRVAAKTEAGRPIALPAVREPGGKMCRGRAMSLIIRRHSGKTKNLVKDAQTRSSHSMTPMLLPQLPAANNHILAVSQMHGR